MTLWTISPDKRWQCQLKVALSWQFQSSSKSSNYQINIFTDYTLKLYNFLFIKSSFPVRLLLILDSLHKWKATNQYPTSTGRLINNISLFSSTMIILWLVLTLTSVKRVLIKISMFYYHYPVLENTQVSGQIVKITISNDKRIRESNN